MPGKSGSGSLGLGSPGSVPGGAVQGALVAGTRASSMSLLSCSAAVVLLSSVDCSQGQG